MWGDYKKGMATQMRELHLPSAEEHFAMLLVPSSPAKIQLLKIAGP